MSSNAGIPNPSLSHPSSSDIPASESSKGKASSGKMRVIIEEDGSVVGEYTKVWSTQAIL